jgi:hypothetical protein
MLGIVVGHEVENHENQRGLLIRTVTATKITGVYNQFGGHLNLDAFTIG